MRIGCTSYVYPAGLVPNVRRLAGLTDDIELLVFEGADGAVLPTGAEVSQLLEISQAAAGRGRGFTYTVHLPLDLDVCAGERDFREFSLDRTEEIMELAAPLRPRGFVLHLPGGEGGGDEWTCAAMTAARRLRGRAEIFIENLAYPFEKLKPVVEGSDAMLCLDIGHALAAGDDWKGILRGFAGRTAAVHLYARDPAGSGRHLGLHMAPPGFVSDVFGALASCGYENVVTIELFSEEDFFISKDIVDREARGWAQR